MAWRIGIDIGGTFTDVALVEDASGRIGVAKVPTTPDDLTEGVLSALELAMDRHAVAPAEVGLLSHATTVVTNAILEQTGARAALITTRGFRDVLELRRSARADLYDLFQDAPAMLIPRRRRFEITERIGADAAIVTPLAENEVDGLISAVRRRAPMPLRSRSCSASSTRSTSDGSARCCERRCRMFRSTCRRMCCPKSRSSSAPARRRFVPMSGQFLPLIFGDWSRPRELAGCRHCT